MLTKHRFRMHQRVLVVSADSEHAQHVGREGKVEWTWRWTNSYRVRFDNGEWMIALGEELEGAEESSHVSK